MFPLALPVSKYKLASITIFGKLYTLMQWPGLIFSSFHHRRDGIAVSHHHWLHQKFYRLAEFLINQFWRSFHNGNLYPTIPIISSSFSSSGNTRNTCYFATLFDNGCMPAVIVPESVVKHNVTKSDTMGLCIFPFFVVDDNGPSTKRFPPSPSIFWLL